MDKYITAICFDFNDKPYKYRNIRNTARCREAFEKFCSIKEICYINYYSKDTRKFMVRLYRQPGGNFLPNRPL